MDLVIKVISCGMVTLILSMVVPADRKEIRAVLGVTACCVIAASTMIYLQPIAELVEQVNSVSRLNSEMIGILWKTVGIGAVTEIAGLICKDFANGTLEKMMQFVGSAAILWLMIPLFQEFIKLIEDVLERM